MANIRGVGGGMPSPIGGNGGPNLSAECQQGINHTQDVASKLVLTHFGGVELNITEGKPGADKVNHLFFG